MGWNLGTGLRRRFPTRPDELQRTFRVPEVAYSLYDRFVGPLSVPLRGYPLQAGEPLVPFFIVGAGRSGTTLVRRIASGHPELHVPPEARISLAIRVYRRNHRSVWEDLVRVTLASFAMTSEFGHFEMRLTPLYKALCGLPKRERSLAKILDGLYRAHALEHGVDVRFWGDKTPSNARFLDRVETVFPACRVIHVVRDGLDVTYSSAEAKIAHSLESAALRWRNEATAAHRWVVAHPEQSLTIRYEDLVTAPRVSAEAICSLLGISYDERMLTDLSSIQDIRTQHHMQNVLKPISSASIGRGRRQYSAEREPHLNTLLNPTLRAFGYPDVDA